MDRESCAGYLGHPFGKEAHDKRMDATFPLASLRAVNRKQEEEALDQTRGANEAPEPTCEAAVCVEENNHFILPYI